MLLRRHLLLAATFFALSRAGAAQAPDEATGRIRALYGAFEAVMRLPSDDRGARIAALNAALRDAFDFVGMAKLAIGPGLARLPPVRQETVQEAFKAFIIATWTGRFLGVSGTERFEVIPASEARPGGRLVRTRVIDPAGTFEVNYLIGPQGGIIDAYLAASVSEAARLRPELDAALKAGGADGLEQLLRERAEKALSSPSLKPSPPSGGPAPLGR